MLGAGLSLTRAAVKGAWSPPAARLDLDFRQDRYIQAGAARSFGEIFAYSGPGLRSFTDRTGKLVWNAHNLLAHSADLTQGTTNAATATADRLTAAADAGTVAPEALRAGVTLPDAGRYTYAARVRRVNLRYLAMTTAGYDAGAGGVSLFDLEGGAVASQGAGHLALVQPLADGSFICSISFAADGSALSGTLSAGLSDSAAAHAVSGPDGTEAMDVSAQWLYRCDLGGMADNPDNALGAGFAKYVPTGAAPVFKPRRNAYQDGKPAGLRFESAAAANLLLYGSDISQGGWTTSQTSTPDGELVRENTADSTHKVKQAIPGTTIGEVYTFSADLKAAGRTDVLVREDQYDDVAVEVDLAAGTIFVPGSAIDNRGAGISDIGDGWYRVWVSGIARAATWSQDIRLGNAPGVFSYPGDGVSGIRVRRAQFEQGHIPSSYIPTAGSPAVRPAETLAIRASALPAAMPDAVSLALEGGISFADTGANATARFLDWRADGSSFIRADLNTGGPASGQVQLVSARAGAASTASGAETAYAPGGNVPFEFAARHHAVLLELAADGQAVPGVPAPAALPDLAAADIGLAPVFSGSLGRFRLWGHDLGRPGIEGVAP